MDMSYMEIYHSNPAVKEYVDKYCASRRVSVDEALTHLLVRAVIQTKLKGGINE